MCSGDATPSSLVRLRRHRGRAVLKHGTKLRSPDAWLSSTAGMPGEARRSGLRLYRVAKRLPDADESGGPRVQRLGMRHESRTGRMGDVWLDVWIEP